MSLTDHLKDRFFVPPLVEGEAAAKIIADFKREPTELEIAVLQRAMKNRLKRRNRAKQARSGYVIE